MIHPLKSIDPDGVLPKKLEYKHLTDKQALKPVVLNPNKKIKKDFLNLRNEQISSYEGYNQSCSDHQELGVEWQIEEFAIALYLACSGSIFKWEEQTEGMRNKWRRKSKAISQNSKILKIVKFPA